MRRPWDITAPLWARVAAAPDPGRWVACREGIATCKLHYIGLCVLCGAGLGPRRLGWRAPGRGIVVLPCLNHFLPQILLADKPIDGTYRKRGGSEAKQDRWRVDDGVNDDEFSD